MAKLMFAGEEGRVLFEHARGQKEQSATYAMLCEPKYLKAGEVMPEDGIARQDQIDPTKLEPHLFLVKDEGAYLMSGARARLPGKDGKPNYVVYADGYGPDAPWEKLQAALGGDDFAESIPLSMLEQPIADVASTIWISITTQQIGVEWEKPRAGPTCTPRVRPVYDRRELTLVVAESGALKKSRVGYGGTEVRGGASKGWPCAGVSGRGERQAPRRRGARASATPGESANSWCAGHHQLPERP